MRLISLNTWGGRAMHPLMHFFKDWRDRVDIFCLQEVHDTTQEYRERQHPDEWVRWDLWLRLRDRLPEFNGYFARFDDNPNRMSVATLTRKYLSLVSCGSFEVFRPSVPVEHGSAVISSRKLHFLTTLVDGRSVVIINYHGLWVPHPQGKKDTPDRITQSLELKAFMARFDMPVVFCGDLNLEPNTESLAILEKGMRNLVKEYDITSTRTLLYREFNNPTESKFADYILVSPGVKVLDFKVLPDLVSDHAALYLDFTV